MESSNSMIGVMPNGIIKPVLFDPNFPLTFSTPNYVGYIAKRESCGDISNNGTEFTFAPSQDFCFKFYKDDDCNIDIYLHTNPKHIIRDIGKLLLFAKNPFNM